MSSNKDAVTSSASSERLTGRVKWFNNKTGYGFITVTDGERSGSDIFVHHSTIGVSSQQYKYLVQGEYVDFDLISTQGGAHEFQATNVVGIKGGKLMCETRHEFKVARTNYKSTQVSEPVTVSRQNRAPITNRLTETKSTVRARGEGPRDSAKKEWTIVKGRQSDSQTHSKRLSRTSSS
jgi:cold shock CspA family protein